jgi:hypothetical protein
MARKSFLLASTLLEPVPPGYAGRVERRRLRAAPPAINVDASNKAANILVFMTISLLDDSGLVVLILATRTLSGRLKARKLGTGYGHPRSGSMAEKNEPRQPTHRAYSVIRREGQDDFWLNLGLVRV